MKKVLSFIVVFALAFVLAGCSSSGIDKATDRLEAEGYTVALATDEDLEDLDASMAESEVEAVYLVKTDYEDIEITVAWIFEFESESALEEALELEEGESIEDYEDFIYKNLFVLDMGSWIGDEDVMPIIKGE